MGGAIDKWVLILAGNLDWILGNIMGFSALPTPGYVIDTTGSI